MDFRLFTFLRDPVDRLISVYRYNASPISPNYQAWITSHPDFEAWVMGYPANDVSSFTVGAVGDMSEYLDKMYARFDFIGFQEHYEESMTRLGRLLGHDLPCDRVENATQATDHNRIEVSDELRAKIRDRNRMDCEVYQILKDVLYGD